MHPSIKFFIAGSCLVILAGCSVTRPSKFYILTPVEDGSAAAMTAPGPALGIGPVTFPAYLDRPEIVHRSGDNQLHYAGTQRWAEPLKTTFSHTLAENLSRMLPTDRTRIHPWPRSTRLDYQVTVDVLRFDADADGTVVLVSGWEVIRADDGTVVDRNRTTYTETAGTFDYPAIVAAQSRAVQRLGNDITATLQRAGSTSE